MLHLRIVTRRLNHICKIDDLIERGHPSSPNRMPPDRLRNARVIDAIVLIDEIGTHVGVQEQGHRRLDPADGNPAPPRLSGKLHCRVGAPAVMQKPCGTRAFLVHAEASCQFRCRIRHPERMLIASRCETFCQTSAHLLIRHVHAHDITPSLQYTPLRHAVQDAGWIFLCVRVRGSSSTRSPDAVSERRECGGVPPL